MKRKIVSLFLVIGMISTLSISIYARTMTDIPGAIGYGHIEGDGVRFRKGPSTSATILGHFTNGEEVIMCSCNEDDQGDWIYVYRIKTKQYGYVHDDYFVYEGPN